MRAKKITNLARVYDSMSICLFTEGELKLEEALYLSRPELSIGFGLSFVDVVFTIPNSLKDASYVRLLHKSNKQKKL